MKRAHCQGEMRRSTAPFHVDRKGYHLSLDEVPALVCSQCGEPHFEEREVESIQTVLSHLDEQMTRMAPAA